MKGTFCLIILLIIYIPILYVIMRKGKKAVVKIILIILAILFMPIIYIIIGLNFPYYYLAPFEGKVIDADIKAPIAGAAVLAVYYKTVHTIAGSNSYAIDGLETLTDKNGEFKIPEVKKRFGDKKGEPRGTITIFIPGHGVFPDYERAIAVGVSDTWPPSGKYIVYELPRLKTREDRRSNLPSRPDIPYAKMKNFVRLINEERISLGFSPLIIPKEGSQ